MLRYGLSSSARARRDSRLQEQAVNPLLCISARYFLAHGIGSKGVVLQDR